MGITSPLVPELLLPVHTFLQLFRGTRKGRVQRKERPTGPTHNAQQASRERHSQELRKAAAAFASHLAPATGSQVCAGPSGGSGVAIACTTECQELVTRMWAKSCRGAPLRVPTRQHGIGNPQGTGRAVIAVGAPSHRPNGAPYSLAGADSSSTWRAHVGSVFEDRDISHGCHAGMPLV